MKLLFFMPKLKSILLLLLLLSTCLFFTSSSLEVKHFVRDAVSHSLDIIADLFIRDTSIEDQRRIQKKPMTFVYSFGEHSSLDSIIPYVSARDSVWIEALNRIPIGVKPSKIKYNLYYRMRLPEDFDVTVRYVGRTDWENVERGVQNVVVANFKDCRTGKDYVYKDTYWGFSKGSGVLPGGENEKDGDVHYFNYEWPDEPYEINDRAAFQFMDVDFDGTKELLASEGDFSREGNAQRIYRLKGDRVVPADDLPFSCVRDLTTKFDAEKKTVVFTESDIDGLSRFVIKRINDSIPILREPTFQTSYSKVLWKTFDFTKNEVFTLDSVYEQSELEPGVYFFAEYKRSEEDLKMLRLEMRKEEQENEEDL